MKLQQPICNNFSSKEKLGGKSHILMMKYIELPSLEIIQNGYFARPL